MQLGTSLEGKGLVKRKETTLQCCHTTNVFLFGDNFIYLPECLSRSHQDSEKLIRGEESPYMVPGGTFVGLLFQNTCVLSSLLAGIHITATRFSKIKDYFMTDSTVGAVITFLDNKMYNEAMGLWLINLDLRVGRKLYFFQNECLDCRGYVEDFLPNFDDLTIVKYEDDNNDHDMSPSACIYNGTLR